MCFISLYLHLISDQQVPHFFLLMTEMCSVYIPDLIIEFEED